MSYGTYGAMTDDRSRAVSTIDDNGDSFSVIDRFSVFDGTFRAERDLRIDGEVKGTIDCHGTLFVAQGAIVSAKVNAENITVAGEMSGEIQCRGRLQLLPSGRLKGQVNTSSLVISEGAIYEGQLSMEANRPEANGGSRDQPSQPNPVPITPAPPAREPVPASREAASDSGPSTFIRRLGEAESPWSGNSNANPDTGSDDDDPSRS